MWVFGPLFNYMIYDLSSHYDNTHSQYRSTSSFWNQPEKASDSWNWKCLLKLRVLAENFVKCTIGNGRRASFWFDNWTPLSPLINSIGTDGPRNLRVPLNAKVCDTCNQDGWSLTNPRSEESLRLHTYLTTISLPSDTQKKDTYDWVVDGKTYAGYSSKAMWAVLRPRAAAVGWFSSVWFKGATPRHAFTMWTANLDRLPTKSRLLGWGMNIDPTCGLCSLHLECRDHLLLSCDFALFIWNAVCIRLQLPQVSFSSWPDLLDWTRTKHVNSPSTLRKLVAQSVIYAIWKQRNNHLHNQTYILPSLIFKEIDREIKNSITARRLKKRFMNLMSCWLH
ncbi:unnamed protein product [Arabidopsis halleri]